MFLADHFPSWEIKYFPDTPAGMEAIAAGEADCVIISYYRFNNIAKQCEKLHLTTVYTGVDMEYYFAVRRGDTQLYSILAKTTAVVPDSTIHAALTYYSTEDAKKDFVDFLKDNLVLVLLGGDFENRAELLRRFEEEQVKADATGEHDWDKVSISSGLAAYDPLLDPTLKDLAQRADQMMYENKRARKERKMQNA